MTKHSKPTLPPILRLLALFALLIMVTSSHAQPSSKEPSPTDIYESLSPEQKKEFSKKYIKEFLDVDMFLDVVLARRFNYIDDNTVAEKLGNRKLRQTLDYFTQKTNMEVSLLCRLEKEHFWVTWMGLDKPRSGIKLSEGCFTLRIEIVLYPDESWKEGSKENLYQPVIHFSVSPTYNSKIKEQNREAFETYLSDSLPLMRRDEFIPKLNDKIVTALLKLLGDEVPPITVSLQPKNALAYDSCLSARTRMYYESINLHGEERLARWASIEKGKSLMLEGIVKQHLPDSIARPLQLKRNDNLQQGFKSTDSLVSFTVGGFSSGDNTLKAVYQAEEGKGVDILAGQLNVAAYKRETYKVVIVPLQGLESPAAAELKRQLDSIYGQAVVDWQVEVDNSFQDYTGAINIDYNSNSASGSAGMYDQSMNELIAAYKKKNSTQKKTRYLFLISKFANADNPIDIGYMPYQQQFGFVVFKSGIPIARTLAHELGHGSFGLKHTGPSTEYGIDDSYGNLMGYNDKGKLFKFQWDIIHNSKAGETEFESAEEVMAKEDEKLYVKIDEKRYKNRDTVFVSTEEVKNFKMEAYYKENLLKKQKRQWVGVDKDSNDLFTISGISPSGKNIKLIRKDDTLSLTFIRLTFSFARAAEGEDGNAFGYDDMDTTAVDQHYISVAIDGTTYLDTRSNALSQIELKIEPALAELSLTSSGKIMIHALSRDGKAKILALNKNTLDTLASINLVIYKTFEYEGKICIHPQALNGQTIQIESITSTANNIYKHIVGKLKTETAITYESIDYDFNQNGVLDYFYNVKGGGKWNYEVAKIDASENGKITENILLLPSSKTRLFFLKSFTVEDTTITDEEKKKIYIGSKSERETPNGFERNEYYTIGDPHGRDLDTFRIVDITSDNLNIIIIIDRILQYKHPTYNILQPDPNSHFITPLNSVDNIAGLSPTNNTATLVFVEASVTNLNAYIARVIVHEQLHGGGLNHVKNYDNIMYYFVGRRTERGFLSLNALSIKTPLRFKSLQLDPTNNRLHLLRSEESQWEILKR